MKKKLLKLTRFDRRIIGAAILAAPVFWGLAYAAWQPLFDPAWPIKEPGRFLFLVFLIPVVEELCFRGVIQPYLYRKTAQRYLCKQLSLANCLTSLLFAVLHLIQHPLAWSIATFVPSLLFGWLRERSGKTWPAAAMHIYFNCGYFYFLGGV